MKAAVFYGPGDLRLSEVPRPRVEEGSILLKVMACSICGSDLRISRFGNPRVVVPRIIGHEIAGIVEAVGSGVENYKIGDFVSVGADIPCGACKFCHEGRPNCCDTNYAIGYQFDGGFAEYVLLGPLVINGGPIQKFKSPLSFEAAALAEPLACCINGFEQAMVSSGKSVLIFGAGPIGLMLTALAKQKYFSGRVIVVEPSAFRREQALRFGADNVIDPASQDVVSAIMALTSGNGADTVFTANAVRVTHEWAISSVSKRGVVNLFGGLPSSEQPISMLSNHIHYREAYVTGSHGSSPLQHRDALCLIERGIIDARKFISDTFSLSKIEEAFEVARSGQALKVVVKPFGG